MIITISICRSNGIQADTTTHLFGPKTDLSRFTSVQETSMIVDSENSPTTGSMSNMLAAPALVNIQTTFLVGRAMLSKTPWTRPVPALAAATSTHNPRR